MKIHDEKLFPICIWDIMNKKPIAIFDSFRLANIYLFPNSNQKRFKIYNAFYNRGKMKTEIFDFYVVVRRLNSVQMQIKLTDGYYIFEGYPQIKKHKIEGFQSNRYNLYLQAKNKKL
jgi:hypothetical protein